MPSSRVLMTRAMGMQPQPKEAYRAKGRELIQKNRKRDGQGSAHDALAHTCSQRHDHRCVTASLPASHNPASSQGCCCCYYPLATSAQLPQCSFNGTASAACQCAVGEGRQSTNQSTMQIHTLVFPPPALTQVVVEGLHVAHEHLALNAVDGGLQRNLAHHTQALDHLVLA
eukprot:scaffold279502_cov17-Tisochrysis_lutea.AAC.1